MEMPKTHFPKRIYILAFGWLLVSGLNLVEAISKLGRFPKTQRALQKLIFNPPEELANTIDFLTPLIKSYGFFLFFGILFSLSGFVAAINLLCIKNWARKVLQILSWLVVLTSLSGMAFALYFKKIIETDGYSLKWGLGVAIGSLMIVACLFAVSAWLLGSKPMVDKFRNSN